MQNKLIVITMGLLALISAAEAREHRTPFLQLAGCVFVPNHQSNCQPALDVSAGYSIDYDQPYLNNLWPDDSELFSTNSLTTQQFDKVFDGFSIRSQLDVWKEDAVQSNPDNLLLDINASYELSSGGLTFRPGGRLLYSQLDSNDDSQQEALTLSLNGQVSYTLSQDWGLLLPFASFQWTYQFDNLDTDSGYRLITDMSGQAFDFSTQSDQALEDQNYLNLGVGFSAQFRNGAAGFINYQQLLGHDEVDDYRLRAGFRYEF